MPLTYIHCVGNLKKLTQIPRELDTNYRDTAVDMDKIAGYYHYSPTFILFNGRKSRKDLIDKYRMKYNYNDKCGWKNLLTVFFCDELVIFSTLVLVSIIMSLLWLPVWRMDAYWKGYNTIEENPFVIACHANHWGNKCLFCDQYIFYEKVNGTYHFEVSGGARGCNDKMVVACPMIEKTGIDAVKNYTNYDPHGYVFDPHSFFNDTYITYLNFGDEFSGGWYGIVCYQTKQGKAKETTAVVQWSFTFIAIIIGCIIFYTMMNKLISYSFIRFPQFTLPDVETTYLLG